MAERIPLTLQAYRALTSAGTALAPHLLKHRLHRGKEHPDRLAERRGEPSAPRLPGPLVWVHGASVGEFVAVTPLLERIRARGLTVLMTTGTVTSAVLAERRLPAGAVHQFIPLDVPPYMTRFLDYWRPDLALLVESDLWPNMILAAAAREIPLILVNGRLSERSFNRWQKFAKTIETLLCRFDLCLVRSPDDADRFATLGAPRIAITGNLKLDVPPLPIDAAKQAILAGATRGRTIVVAASTHPGEDSVLIDAHRRLRLTFPNLLTIVAPRHPQRGDEIVEVAKAAELRAVMRSRGELPTFDTDVYVFDTVGELGLIYQLAPIVFMGGSLVRHGGQNPIEAIKLGAAVVHGPHVSNFKEIYAALSQVEGATMVMDADQLTGRIGGWIEDAVERDRIAAAAAACVARLGGALDRTTSALEPYFMQLRIQNRAADA